MHDGGTEILTEVERRADILLQCGSHQRPNKFSELFKGVRSSQRNGELFWRLFHNEWAVFDAINHSKFIELMRRFRRWWRPEYMEPANLTFFAALPETITAYRGQHESHWGLSWTTDRDTALYFSTGGRMRHDTPRLLTVRIPKSAIAGVFTQRSEDEVVIFDFQGLSDLSVIDATEEANCDEFRRRWQAKVEAHNAGTLPS